MKPKLIFSQPFGLSKSNTKGRFHVQSSGKDEVKGGNILVAIFSEKESQSVFLLEQSGLTRLDAVSYLSHGEARILILISRNW